MPSKTVPRIIFWKYNKEITFEELSSYDLEDAYSNMEAAFEIPLDNFSLYYWDEQILRMDRLVFEKNNYKDKFLETAGYLTHGMWYFSIVIKDKIVLNGLNRCMIIPPNYMTYDRSKYPKILAWAYNNKYVFFRFSYVSWPESIWDVEEEFGDVELLFVDEIFNYFKSSKKIQRGKFDHDLFLQENNLIFSTLIGPFP